MTSPSFASPRQLLISCTLRPVRLLSSVLILALVPMASGQNAPVDKAKWVGDSATEPLPLAHDLSAKLDKKDVAHAMQKVADWELKRATPYFNKDWTFAALYDGFMAVPDSVGGKKYHDAMFDMGKQFQWGLNSRLEHADDQAIGQTYIDLRRLHHDPAITAPIQERMDAVMKLPDNPNKPLWWWCDALFMAPPVLAKLSKDTGDKKYLDFMDHEWWITSSLLYSPADHLYYRDNTYFKSHETNGAKVFWSRGNGWVFAGLARVLTEMPADYPSRQKYVTQYREMAEKIASLQGDDGLWKSGLLDQADYKLPENSGSAFFAYGFAWGINHGILDRAKYLPVVERAWKGLLGHVYEDGRLGSVQQVGAAPGVFEPTSAYVFGTGAFLLAGSEIYKLAR